MGLERTNEIKEIVEKLSNLQKELLSNEKFYIRIEATFGSKGCMLAITDLHLGRKVIPPIIKMLKDEIDSTSIEAGTVNIGYQQWKK